jgi:hypothetical protein
MDTHQEKMEAKIYSIRSEVEETIKYWVEDNLSCRPKDTVPPQGTDREENVICNNCFREQFKCFSLFESKSRQRTVLFQGYMYIWVEMLIFVCTF